MPLCAECDGRCERSNMKYTVHQECECGKKRKVIEDTGTREKLAVIDNDDG
jgi:hypothetical protein